MVHRWTFTNGFNYNCYVPGSGVGAQTISVRRHLKRFAHHCASEPVRYALEMEQGWFSRNNVGIGDRITNVAS